MKKAAGRIWEWLGGAALRAPAPLRARAAALCLALSASVFAAGVQAAAPVFKSTGTAAAGTGAVTPAWPAHQTDDIGLLFIEAEGNGVISLTTPNGFVLVSSITTGAAAGNTLLAVYWARATSGAMASPVVADAGDHTYAVINTFRGSINNLDPWDILSSGIKTPASTSVSAAGVTTTQQNTLPVVAVSRSNDATGAAFSLWSNAALAGLTENFDGGSNSGLGGGIAVATGRKAAAGATGNTTATVTSSINAYLTIALKPLNPPATGVIQNAAETQLGADWALRAGATGYTLAASVNPGDAPSPIAASSTTIALNAIVGSPALDPNTTYYLFVRSDGLRQSSYWDTWAATSTLANIPVFNNFTGLGAGAIQFNWTANSNPAWTDYRVKVSTAPDPLAPGAAVVSSSDTLNLFLSSSGLTANTTYFFRVAAVNNNNIITAYTAAQGTVTLANQPVFSGFSGVTASAAQFSWTQNSNPDGTLYRVKVSTAPDPLSPGGAVVTSSDTYNLYLSSTGLAVNTTYYFRAAAVNHAGIATSYTAALGTATLANLPVFDSFSGLTVSAAQFGWTQNGNPDGTLYRVKVSTAADPLAPDGAVVTSSDTYNLYLSSADLAANTTYYFRAAAVNHNGVPTAYTAAQGTATLAAVPVFDSFSGVTVSAAQFGWTQNGNPNGTLYRVAVSTAPDPLAPGGAVVSSSDTYNLYLSSTGLSINTTYYFRAAAVNRNGVVSSYSAAQGTATLAAMPVFDSFSGVTVSGAQFGWTQNGNPDGTLYRVKVSTAADPLAPGGAVVTSSDTYNLYLSSSGLAANTTYYFRAAALNHNGVASSYSAAQATATLAAMPVFDSFSGVTVSAAQFGWTQNGNPDGTLYRVKVSTAADPLAPAGAVVSSSDTYNLYLSSSGLAVNSRYYFRAAAVNHGGAVSAYSAAQGTFTLANLPVFGSFSGVTETAQQFGWTQNGNPDGTLYRVAVSTAPDPLSPGEAVFSSSDTYNLFLSSSGLNGNTTYYYRAAAVNGDGVASSYSAAQATSTLAAQPSAFDFTYTSSRTVRLDWSDSGNGSGTLYRVAISTAADPLAPNGAVVTSSDTFNLYVSTTGLVVNTYYYFRAAARNNNGIFTAYTAAVSTKTLQAGVLAAPLAGSLTPFSSSVTANWGLVSGATGYVLAVSLNPGAPPSPIFASSETAALSAYVEGLSADTVYYPFVRSGGPDSSSTWSDYSPVATLLAFPPVFTAFSGLGNTAVNFAWDANGNTFPGTLFRVWSSSAPDPLNPGGAVAVSSDTYNLSLSTTGLAVNTTYYFRVAGLNKDGAATAYTAAQATATLANAPAFTGFTGLAAAEIQFNLSEAGNPEGTLYRILVSTAPDPLSPAGAVVTASDTYNAWLSSAGLGANAYYYFRAAAVNRAGTVTAYTAAQGTSTLADNPVFSAFSGVGETAAQFAWSGGVNPAGTLYRVKVSTASDPLAPAGAVVSTSDTYNTSLSSSGLSSDKAYYFRVAAVNQDAVLTAYTAAQSTHTLTLAPAFQNFTGVAAAGLQFNWASANPAGTLYRVKVSTASDPLSPAGAAVSSSDTYNAYLSSSGLTADTTYFFRVAGVNGGGSPTAYTAARGTATLVEFSPVFSNFTSISTGSVNFNWAGGGNPGGTLYRVLTSPALDPLNPGGEPVTSSDTYNTSLSSASLSPNVTYYFVVAGLNKNGVTTAYTAAQGTSTLAEAPVFANFTNVTAGSIQFNYTAGSNSYPDTQYRVVASTAADPLVPAGAEVLTTDTPELSVYVTGLTEKTTYYFRAAALNNNSMVTAYTVAQSTVTPPSVATKLFLRTLVSPVDANAKTLNTARGSAAATYTKDTVAAATPRPPNIATQFTALAAGTTVAWYTPPLQANTISGNMVFNIWARESANNANATVTGVLYRAGNSGVLISTIATALIPRTELTTTLAVQNWTRTTASTVLSEGDRLAVAIYIASGTGVAMGTGFNVTSTLDGPTAAASGDSWVQVTETLAPVKPSGFSVTAVTTYSVTAGWGLVEGATSYTFVVSEDAVTPPLAIAASSVTLAVSAAAGNSLAANTTYYLFARSHGLGSASNYGAYSSTVTLARTPVFDSFSGVTGAAAQFSWTAGGNPAGTRYRMAVSTAADPLAPGGAAVTFADTYDLFLATAGLSFNTTYYFRAAAVNHAGIATSYTAAQATATAANLPVFDSFSGLTETAARFNWLANGNPAGTLYSVLASTAPDPLSPVGAAVSSSQTYNNFLSSTGLYSNTTYYFRVAAVNHPGIYTAYTAAQSTATLAAMPVFSGFSGVTTSAEQFSWTANGNSAGTLYRVKVSTAADPLSPAGALVSSSDTYNFSLSSSGLAANTTYYFRAAAVGRGDAVSAYSAAQGTATLANLPVFSAFSGVTEAAAQFAWTQNGNPGGTLYRVAVSTASDPLSPGWALVTSSDTYSLSLATAGLSVNTTYYFRAAALNHNGVITAYSVAEATPTLAAMPVFDSFSGVTVSAAQFAWTSANPAGTLYRVRVSTAPDPLAPAGAAVTSSDTYNAFLSSSGLSANLRYFFRAAAVNRGGTVTAYSAAQGTYTLANLPVSAGFTGVTEAAEQFNWTASNPGGTLYRVKVSTAPDPLSPGEAVASSSDTYNLFLSSAGLNGNTTYYYRAAAVNGDGVESSYSAAAGTSTLAAQPSAFDFTYTSSRTIQLDWSDSGNGPGTLYRVAISTAPDPLAPNGALVTSSDTFNLYVSTTGLAPNKDYYFRAAARNNYGFFTSYTAAVSSKTLMPGVLAAPLAIDLIPHPSSFTATWGLVSGATGYVLAVSVNPGAPPTPIFSSSETAALSAQVPGLDPDTIYYAFVRSGGPDSASTWSDYPAAATLLANPPVFTAFSGLGNTAATFGWSANGNVFPGTKFRVWSSTAPDPLSPGEAVAVSSDTYNLTLSSAGLAVNTTYYFRVAGVNKDGVATAYTAAQATATIANAPAFAGFSGLTAADIQFNLSDGGNPEGTLYRVLVSTAPDPLAPAGAVVTASDTYNAWLSSAGLGANAYYYFRGAAVNRAGTVTAYTAAQGTSTLADNPVFSAFSGVGDSAAQFAWSGGVNPAGTLYRVKVSTAPDPLSPDGAVVSSSDTYNTYLSSSGLSTDTAYYFRAAAVNQDAVLTAYTAAQSTHTLTLAPAFSDFTGMGAAAAQFNWSGGGNPAGTLYRVKVSTAPDPLSPGGAAVSSSDTYNTYLSSSGLAADTTYFFRVAGVNGGGSPTAYTAAQGTATLVEFSPVFSNFTSISTGSVNFNWAGGGNPAGTRYRVLASPAPDPLNPGGQPVTSSDTYNTSLSSASLSPNVTYYFVVAGLNKNGVPTAYTAAQGTSTLAEAPVFQDFTSISAGAIQFNYTAGNNPYPVTQYQVLTSTAADPLAPAGAEVLTTDTPELSVYVTGLAEKTTYYFRAAAFNNNSVVSAYSVAASTVTPPSVATKLFLRTLASPVDANAKALSTARGPVLATYTKDTVAAATPRPPNIATQFTALAAGTTVAWYTPPLQANTISGNMVFNIWANESHNSANATVTGVLYRADNAGVLISTIATALIPRAELATTLAVQNWTRTPVSTDLSEGDRLAVAIYIASGTGVAMGTPYNVTATLDGPTAAVSGDSWVQVTETLAPVKPSGFSVAAVTTYSVTAGWTLREGATGYTFAVSLDMLTPPLAIAASSVTLAASAEAGNSLTANTTYYLFARSHGLGSNSNYGAYGSTVTLARTPVFDSFSEVAARSARFNWTAGGNPGGTRYRVAVSTAADPLAPAGAAVTLTDTYDLYFTSSGLTSGAAYYFRVAAVSHAGILTSYTAAQTTTTLAMYLNEVYPSGVSAAADWAELYNNTAQTVSLQGWKLNYVENTIEIGGTPNTVWTGQAGDTITAFSTFAVSGLSLNLNGAQTYHVKLLDASSGVADEVQWPSLAEGQSFARAVDGAATYFEIDPTPTKGRANAISTDTFRINEAAYGPLGMEFIELYNTSVVSTRTLAGYALRNKASSANGLVFRFTRKLYPQGYTLIDSSSLSDDGYTFAQVFGAQGLAAAGDFLALENSTGSVVDAAAWQSGGNYPRYDNRGAPLALADYAAANAATSVMRQPSEGADTGSDAADFSVSASATIGSRNNGAGSGSINALAYPGDNSAPRYLSRRFPLRLTLGEDSVQGGADTLILTRTGGTADSRSPHIFRLADLGLDLSVTAEQAPAQYGPSFTDQDGWPLVSSASYRLVLNSDSAADSAPQLVRDTVTYDGSVHAVTASTSAPLWMNNASRVAAVKLQVSNNSPAGFNGLTVTTVAFRLLDSDLAPLTQQQGRDLFNAVLLARDAAGGTAGLYEPGIDLSTVAYVPMAQLTLDGLGYSTLTVAAAYISAAAVPAASTVSFYVVLESTRNASARTPNVFRASLDPASGLVLDVSGGLPQDFSASVLVNTSSVTLIAPALPPANSSWPYVTPSSAPINTLNGVYLGALISVRSYVASTDGYVRALSTGGELLWTFATSPLSAINSSPTDGEESGGFVYLYFADDNGDVYKVRDNGATPTQIWKRALGSAVRSEIIVSGDKLYFGAADSKMHCLDKTTAGGSDCDGWTDLPVSGVVSATPLVDDRTGVNAAWVGTESGGLVQLNTGSGGSAGSYATGSAIRSSPFGDTAWAGSSNRLFLTSTDGKLYSATLDFATVDASPAGAAIYSSPFVWTFSGTRYVFFGDEAGYLHKVSTENVTTMTEPSGWPFRAGGAIRSGPVIAPANYVTGVADPYVYFGCDDGYIYAVNAETGQLRTGWPVATGGPVRADPVLDSDGTLTVGSNDGRTYVLNIGP